MSVDGSTQSTNTAGRNVSIDGAVTPSLNETVIALNERSKSFATREDLLKFKDEIVKEVHSSIAKCYDNTSSVTRWAVGTVAVACLTLAVSIGLAVYNAASPKTASQPPISAALAAPIQQLQPQRIELVITVNGDEVQQVDASSSQK